MNRIQILARMMKEKNNYVQSAGKEKELMLIFLVDIVIIVKNVL
jgi:hypothetical protein